MILTGREILKERGKGHIILEPFDDNAINPNSYNYRLGPIIKEFKYFDGEKSVFEEFHLNHEGFVLEPRKMYLGHTLELIGSSKYAMSLIGRSSLGRLGLFLQISANLGHTTSKHQWTLEIVATNPIRLYPEMIIGQVSFWENHGDIKASPAHYANYNLPYESRGVKK
jgi:dCTP deaminase